MHIETLVIVTGLADDHLAVCEALTAAATLVLPNAVVTDPVVPPALGFELVLAVPKPVNPAALEELRQALAAELHRREILHAELSVEALVEAEPERRNKAGATLSVEGSEVTMPAITMIIWLGTTPAQMQAVQSAQPAVYRQDLIRVQEQRAQAERAIETRAPRDGRSFAPPSSTR